MRYSVTIVPQAVKELEDISYFIALDDLLTAESFVGKLITTLSEVLSTLPESGAVYKGVTRKITYKKYTAFYRVKKKEK